MSGRTIAHLADGRRVVGFRKTLRRNIRSSPGIRPELRLTFILPDRLAFATRSGQYGFALVDADGLVTVKGRDREFILRKAGEFLDTICHGLTLDPFTAVLFTPSRPAPTPEAPARPPHQEGYSVEVRDGSASIERQRVGFAP